MLRFDHKVIHALHAAAVDAGLSRDALLAGINPGLIASLARASTPGAQLRLDLARLNQLDRLSDGTMPLEIWLQNALHLCAFRPESEVFSNALKLINEQNSPSPNESNSPPAPPLPPRPENPDVVRIFLSAAPEDHRFVDLLRKHAAPLLRTGAIRIWGRRDLLAGENISKRFQEEIEAAQLVLSFLSADYFASAVCEEDIHWAFKLHSTRGLRIVPVLARPCNWKLSPFAKFQALPNNKTYITEYSDPDSAMVELLRAIGAMANDLAKANLQSAQRAPSLPGLDSGTIPTQNAKHFSLVPLGPPSSAVSGAAPGSPLADVLQRNGQPSWTYVEPDQTNGIARALRIMGRGLVIEGPSKIGKSTAVSKILQDLQGKGKTLAEKTFLDMNVPEDLEKLRDMLKIRKLSGHIVIDDAQRLKDGDFTELAGFMRILADRADRTTKITLIGLRTLSRRLLAARPDLSGRYDCIVLERQPDERVVKLIEQAEQAARLRFEHRAEMANRALGSFYLAQAICYYTALRSNIDDVPDHVTRVPGIPDDVLPDVIHEIGPLFEEPIYRFLRADRLSETPGACFAMLHLASRAFDGAVSRSEALQQYPLLGPAFEWIEKEHLASFIDSDSDLPGLLRFHAGKLSILDPLVLYYLRAVDWKKAGRDAGLDLAWVNERPEVILPTRTAEVRISSMTEAMRAIHFLDQPSYPWWDPRAVRLYDWLVRAYLKPIQMELLGEKTGIDLSYWDGRGSPITVWKGLLDIAASQGKLRALVDNVLADPSVAAYHPHIRACIEPTNSTS